MSDVDTGALEYTEVYVMVVALVAEEDVLEGAVVLTHTNFP